MNHDTTSGAVLVDAHCHLLSEAFDGDRDDVISRAVDRGVACALVMGEDLQEDQRILEEALKNPFVVPFAGYHPWKCKDRETTLKEVKHVVSFIEENRTDLAGIGEVGLDYYHAMNDEMRALQRDVLGMFIELAGELDLPLSLHSRSAGKYLVDILVTSDARRICLHAFDGKVGYAMTGAEHGYFFSIPPTVVHSVQKHKLVLRLSLENLLLETDSPALGPRRGERNEPVNLIQVVEKISELKSLSAEELIRSSYEALRRFIGNEAAERWL